MRVTNEQLKGIKQYDNMEVECCCAADTSIYDLSDDLLEARELIKEMRSELEDARTVMEKYEAQLTGELFNDPSLNAILEKSKDYA